MTIPKLTPYTGQVANPDGSQTQTEFTQNMFDQLSYEAQLATQLDATIDGMNNAVDEVEAFAVSAENSANAAEAAAASAGYQGLWPDTGGIADKGDTYQTQVGGTPTGEYYTALQNTSVDPVGDNVNWVSQATKGYIDAKNQQQDALISANSNSITSIDARLIGAEGAVSSLESSVAVNTGDISNVEQRVSDNELDISALQSGQGSGVVAFATQADLFANLNFDEGTPAYVTNDPTPTNNGTYRKVGAIGSGSWVQSSDDLASQAYSKATQNELDIVELEYLTSKTKIFDDLKSVRNEILKDSALNSRKNESSSTGFFSFQYESDDYILKRSGVDQFWSNSGVSPLSEFQNSSMQGKTVLVGCFEYIDPAGGVSPSTLASANQKPNPSAPLEAFDSDSSGFYQVSPNVRLLWSRGVVKSAMANGAYRVNLSSNTDGSKLQFGQFVAFGDASLRWEDVDIFYRNEDNHDSSAKSRYVQSTVGSNTLIEYVASSGDAQAVTGQVIEDIVPNPYAWVLTPSVTGAFTFQHSFSEDMLGRRFSVVFYYYQPDDFTVGSKRLRDVTLDFVNGLSFVTPDAGSEISIKYENFGNGLTKCSITGLFNITLSNSYGLRVVTSNILAGVGDLSIFGAIIAVSDNKIDHGQLTPGSYNSPACIQPVAINPKEVITGSYFDGKKCVWIGTSIPAGREYPQRVASRLNMSLVNLSQGGGRLGAYREDLVFDNNMIYNFMWSSQDSQTYYAPNIGQEVNPDNLSELQPGSGLILTQSIIDQELENHYEFKLSPHSDADLVVVDYGINDRNLQTSSPWKTVAEAGGDPRYFAGAFTKLVEYLYSLNPNIKIVVVGHYLETDTGVNSDTPDVIAAQKDCAKSYGLNFIDMQGNMNINPLNITTYAPDELHPTPGGDLDYRMYRYISSRLLQL